MINLFQLGEFRSHMGILLPFKIDCDALTDGDIDCIAAYIASKTFFGMVDGVPYGGCRLAAALEKYAVWEAPFNILIVDDVLTTGASMEDQRADYLHIADHDSTVHPEDIIGWVIFARAEPPDWVNAMFRMY
jgi:hypothetical protein